MRQANGSGGKIHSCDKGLYDENFQIIGILIMREEKKTGTVRGITLSESEKHFAVLELNDGFFAVRSQYRLGKPLKRLVILVSHKIFHKEEGFQVRQFNFPGFLSGRGIQQDQMKPVFVGKKILGGSFHHLSVLKVDDDPLFGLLIRHSLFP